MNKMIFILIAFSILSSCQNLGGDPDKENSSSHRLYLIPKNYEGEVFIFFDRSCGEEIEITNDTLILKIPDDGILETKYSPPENTTYIPVYRYYDANRKGIYLEKAETRKLLSQVEEDSSLVDLEIVRVFDDYGVTRYKNSSGLSLKYSRFQVASLQLLLKYQSEDSVLVGIEHILEFLSQCKE